MHRRMTRRVSALAVAGVMVVLALLGSSPTLTTRLSRTRPFTFTVADG